MPDLMNVDDAIARILNSITPLPAETIPVTEALNRVLAQDVTAPLDLPPFANSSMDGFALRAADSQNASRQSPVSLRIVMDIPAGTAPTTTLNPGEAARIMTGAPVPDGADAIIPVEDTDADWQNGETNPPDIRIYRRMDSGAYVRPVGEDIAAGTTVLSAGTVLRPQEIGVLIALGFAEVAVRRQPHVAVLTTGDELVGVGEPLAPGQIRDVNSHTIAGLIETNGGKALRLPIARDTLNDVRALFRAAIDAEPDMIVSSAGVSVGAADLIRTVLSEFGAVDFWRINLRPGKPLAYGHVGGIPFFGLPGNPVSAMVTFEVLVRPALGKLSGRPDLVTTITVITEEALTSDGRRSFLRVKLKQRDGQIYATTTGTQSSGALMSMVLADALMIVPEGVRTVEANTPLQARLLRPIPDDKPMEYGGNAIR